MAHSWHRRFVRNTVGSFEVAHLMRLSLYLIREILPLYLACLMLVIILFLISFIIGHLPNILGQGITTGMVAKFLIYKLPSTASFGISLALLFASLIGLTRLTQDGEIKATLLLGVGPGVIARPIIFVGLTVSILSFANNEFVVPWSEHKASNLRKEMLLRGAKVPLVEGNFFADSLGRRIHVESILPDKQLTKITVIKPGGLQGPTEVIQAKEGTLNTTTSDWSLSGIILRLYRKNHLVLRVTADHGDLPVQGLLTTDNQTANLIHLPLKELLKRLAVGTNHGNSAELTALHRKFSEPLAALVFALLSLAVVLSSFKWAIPLGITPILVLTFGYYATSSAARILGEQGLASSWLAGWAPLFIYAILGLGFFLVSWRR
ncbi:MAG: LptF/LptG family permease [Deinococcales bacterium]|nr:LptF/LptG family permease [Deinococcales bacterium]